MTIWDRVSDEESGAPLIGGASRSGSHRSFSNQTSKVAEQADEEEERLWRRRRQEQPGWRVDRGAGFYQEERMKHNRACLVETGRHAGRSRVKFEGIEWGIIIKHMLKRDFFNFAVTAKLYMILIALVIVYTCTITSWAFIYYISWRFHKNCFNGFTGLVSAFLFSVETQQTIGYGARFPNDCWLAAFLIAVHSLVAILIDSLVLGIALARISRPKNRGRTILISDSAVIARRDGVLKFMFRLGDMQKSNVVAPNVQASLYTWGEGRTTAEHEHIPVVVQRLEVDMWDRSMLLPTIVEHTIDESSPLFGMTMKTMENLGAEIVVEFEGSTEMGDMFQVRQSYLSHEIHWGHVFCNIIKKAPPGETQHSVDLSSFHDVEPQPGLEALPPFQISAKVVAASVRCVPPPLLQENTLVLSDEGVVAHRDGRLYLMFRAGDTFPGSQVENVSVEAFMYRWISRVTQEGEALPYSVDKLMLHPRMPTLRYPVILFHEICEGSPIASWTSPAGKRLDADCEIIVTIKGTLISKQQLVTRTRVYPVLGGIKWGAIFVPIVTRLPTPGTALVDWQSFHLSVPMETAQASRAALLKQQSTMTRTPSSSNLLNVQQQQQQLPHHQQHHQQQQKQQQHLKVPATGASHQQGMRHDEAAAAGAAAAPQRHGGVAALAAGGAHDQESGGSAGSQQQHSHEKHKAVAFDPSTRDSSTSAAGPSEGSGKASTKSKSSSARFGTGAGDTWKDTRSLFAAIDAMNELAAAEEQQQQEEKQAKD